MGWSSWIKIPSIKLIIEIPRYTDVPDLEQEAALDHILYSDPIDSEVSLKDVTIKDFRKIVLDSEMKDRLYGLTISSLFFYILENREEEYTILKGDESIVPYRDDNWTIWFRS